MIASIFGCLLALLLLHHKLPAEQLRFDSASDWQQWQLPLGAVALTADGSISRSDQALIPVAGRTASSTLRIVMLMLCRSWAV